MTLEREEAIERLRTYRASEYAGPAALGALDCVAAGADPRMLCVVIERAMDGGVDLVETEQGRAPRASRSRTTRVRALMR